MQKLLIAAACGIFLLQTACNQAQPTITTEHGHRFINHTNGTTARASSGDMATINVFTYLNDSLMGSTVRDFGGPREIPVPEKEKMTEKAPAVYEALYLMAKGDSATIYQAIDSTMKQGIPKSLGDVKEIKYVIVLTDLKTKADVEKEAAVAASEGQKIAADVKTMTDDYKAHKLGDKLKKTASGLEYVIIEQGTGAPLKKGDSVPTHYYGALLKDGTMFDNSYDRGGRAPFTIGQMIPGFDEGLCLLNHGGKATFFIPWNLAYGEQGAGQKIGPKSDLVFYVDVK